MDTQPTPSTPEFFGGDAGDLGHVRRLPAKSFRDFVDQVLNLAVTLNVTRAQYATLDKKARHRVKRVPYVVPCTYPTEEAPRSLENARSITLLCLDVDDAALARPYYSSPEVLMEQLMPFNFAVYTTASSTPEEPRIRIFVEAAHLPVTRYRHATQDIARRIGLSKLTKESYTANLPMYLPTMFKGDDPEAHPLLLSVHDGRAYTVKDLPTDAELLDGEPDAPPPVPDSAYDTTTSGDDLDYLRPTVDNISVLDVKSALEHLDPDMSYPEWLEVAACMRHQFPRDPQAGEAYALFDEWSSRGTKYAGAEDTRAKWTSLRPSPKGRVPLTVRTLLQKAASNGWDATPLKGRCFATTFAWLQQTHTSAQLLGEGLGRVAATPLISLSEEEALLQEIVAQARKQHGLRVGLASLRKDLNRMKSAARQEQKRKEKVPAWCKGICYIAHVNQFFRHHTVEYFSPEALDRAYGNKLLPTEEQLKEMGDDSIGAKARPIVRPQDYLLNIVMVPVAYDTLYDPRNPNDVFIHQEGRVYVNTYIRNHPEPDPDKAEYAQKVFMEHLANLIAEEEYRTTVLDYLSYIVQNPGAKIRWAVLLQGVQGCGKTALATAMEAVLGSGHVKPVDVDAMQGGYNEWAYGAQLVTLEEVRVAGHNRHEVMNKLKPLISNDTVNINQKYRDSRKLDNRTNYLLFTNHHDALALTDDDRRYFVIKSALQTKAQVAALGEKYFVRLFDMLRDYAGGLRHFLENREISATFQPNGHAPATKYLAELISDSSSEVGAAVKDILEDSTNKAVQPDLLSSSVLMQMLELAGIGRCSPQHLAHVLREMGYMQAGRYYMPDGAKHPLWLRTDGTMELKDVRPTMEHRMALETLSDEEGAVL